MVAGGTSSETTQLNIESLWTGGPFAEPVNTNHIILTRPPLIEPLEL